MMPMIRPAIPTRGTTSPAMLRPRAQFAIRENPGRSSVVPELTRSSRLGIGGRLPPEIVLLIVVPLSVSLRCPRDYWVVVHDRRDAPSPEHRRLPPLGI